MDLVDRFVMALALFFLKEKEPHLGGIFFVSQNRREQISLKLTWTKNRGILPTKMDGENN